MIEILDPSEGESVHEGHMSFKEMQARVGGIVECVHIKEGGEFKQVICNEDGLSLRLEYNPYASARLRGLVNMGTGPVGVYMLLSGKDRLK
jgi:hypothetical protein